MPIHFSIIAWYQPTTTDNSTDPTLPGIVTNLLEQLVPGISVAAHGTAAEQVTNGVVQPGMDNLLGTQTPASGAPKAYLNWVLLDAEQFQKVDANTGFTPVPLITSDQGNSCCRLMVATPLKSQRMDIFMHT